MYTVGFMSKDGGEFVFMSDIPTHTLASRVALNLTDEGFVLDAWVVKD